MMPRKIPQKDNTVEEQNGISEGRPQRTRKPVDYRENAGDLDIKVEKKKRKDPVSKKNTASSGSNVKEEKKKRINTGKKGKSKEKEDNETGSEQSEDPTEGQEVLEEASSSKKSRMTYVVEYDDTPEMSLNETFVKKPKATGKGKKNVKSNEESEEEQPETNKQNTEKNKKLNETNTDYSKLDFNSSVRTHCTTGEKWNLKISSWNVDGLRAWLKKDGAKFLDNEKPDILCLQETKCTENKIPPEAKFQGYHSYWSSGEKEGYSGVALFSKEEPINIEYGMGIEEHDSEGRLITAEYENFFLVTTYVPNAGRNLVTLPKRLSWDAAFRTYLKELDSKKPVILCGDMNVAHQEIDLANPKTNTKNAGFTKEERDGMTELLAQGFIDTFRHFYPDKTDAYTFWTYMKAARTRNIGWRLDYFIVSERIIDKVCDSIMRSQVLGSDHCPITLLFHNK